MPGDHLDFARKVEKEAAGFLRAKGYKILEVNYKTSLGEIDIIAEEKGTICFVEVKGRHSVDFGLPCEAVSLEKQKKIARTATCYLKWKRLLENPCRFDVLSVVYQGDKGQATLIKNAFDNPE